MVRRANGDGSIVKLKKKGLKRPYMVRVYQGKKTAAGNYIQKPVDYFATRKEAEAFLAKYTRRPILKYNFTLEELYKEWEEKRQRKVEEGKLSKSALDCNHAAWCWLSDIKDYKVRVITTELMQDILDHMAQSNASRSAIEKVKSLASMLFEYAQQYDITDRNYATWLEIPKVEQIQRDRWSDIEIAKFEKAEEDGIEWADCILMMIYSGFRIDEFLTIKKFGTMIDDNGKILAVIGGNKTEAVAKDLFLSTLKQRNTGASGITLIRIANISYQNRQAW
ncbi:MAG: hypothetical protein ACOX7H_07140 [Bacillota bacterium]|jgi:site-specific recombinase XerD